MLAILVGSATLAVAAPPTFPNEWVAQSAQKIAIYQGGTHPSPTEFCCDKKAGQCKVQTQGLSGLLSVDGGNNRTSLSVGSEAIINLFKEHKQIQAVPDSTGKGWTCKSYCPTDEDYENPIQLDPSAKDLGKTTFEGQTVEHFQWQDKILKTIVMDTNDWYIDTSGSSPVPVGSSEVLTPFGGPAIGESDQLFNEFKAGTPPASAFNIDNLDSCEKSENCGNNDKLIRGPRLSYLQAAKHLASKMPKAEEEKKEKESIEVKFGTVNWPKDWTAQESNGLIVNQGGVSKGENICCESSYGGDCQVQVEYNSGMKYYDFTNQRIRVDYDNGQTIVDLVGKVHKSIEVVHNGTHDVCKAYCPIDPRDTMDGGRDYFLDDNATDLGKTTYEGQSAEHWQWKDTILKVIVMQTTDFYANTDGATALPLGAVSQLTPFGQHLGNQNSTWANFKEGTPPASKFDIQGIDQCPEDPQCGQQSRQLHRLAAKQFHSYARYESL